MKFINAAGEDVTARCRVTTTREGDTVNVTVTNNTDEPVWLMTESGGAEAMSDKPKTDVLIAAAEVAIGALLAKLETETGMVLDKISVHDMDVTSHKDDRPQLLRRVLVEMHRLPGSRWGSPSPS